MTTLTDPVPMPVIETTATDAPVNATPRPRRPHLDLFLISFLILFFELAAIRWFGSTVVFLTFFTNIVLIACFLGMSVGLLTASRRQNFIRWVLPLAFFSIALAMITFNAYQQYEGKVTVTVGDQQKSPQLIYFGTEYRPPQPDQFVIPIEVIGGTFFVLISIMFVGLGQTMGRAFDAIPNRVWAYTIDVFGSLTGIALFGALSFVHASPHAWFIIVVLLLLYFVRDWNYKQVFSALGLMFLIAISAFGAGQAGQVFWSPYYKVTYVPQAGGINTNNISHQQMVKIGPEGNGYALPHLLNRHAGNEPFEKIMIIGAGSGNDVAAALHYGNENTHIDAVEIDPMINQIGRWDHPNKPYGETIGTTWHPNPKVSIHLDDGRSFTRKSPAGKYDLVVYALVDSLVLHSGYSSLRLENFLFTQQAFEDVKKTLKDDGVFAMYNYYRQGWVVGRLVKTAEKVFGVKPVVVSLPYKDEIAPPDSQANFRTFILVGSNAPKLEAIRKRFEDAKNYWVHYSPENNEGPGFNGFQEESPNPLDQSWYRIAPARVPTSQPAGADSEVAAAYAAIDDKLLPQDDWPQLYLREKKIPDHNIRGAAMIGGLSILILFIFAWPVLFGRGESGHRARPNMQMFFLGAGFMLLETKGVVHMALLFGSTWVVNSVVFFAILVMILFANLFVLALKPRNLIPYYILLIAGLLVNALVEMNTFLSLPGVWKHVVSGAVVFLPVFFAGVIFASSFRDSKNPSSDFGSNVFGIILGGLSEYFSLVLGFKYLLFVAIGYYLLSLILKPRTAPPDETATDIREEAKPALQGTGGVVPA